MDERDTRRFVKTHIAGTGKRFANYIIDRIVIILLMVVALIITAIIARIFGHTDDEIMDTLVFIIMIIVWLAYYWGLESLTGKTVGKYITRTRIVKEDGSRPTTINVLGRTMSRLIPFDPFSYLGPPEQGWHDAAPKIYVISE